MVQQDLSKTIGEIENLYRDYTGRLHALRKKQDEILQRYARALEEKKIEVLRVILHQNGGH